MRSLLNIGRPVRCDELSGQKEGNGFPVSL
jgi:hypothetical protein